MVKNELSNWDRAGADLTAVNSTLRLGCIDKRQDPHLAVEFGMSDAIRLRGAGQTPTALDRTQLIIFQLPSVCRSSVYSASQATPSASMR